MSVRENVIKCLGYCSNDCSQNCPYFNVDGCIALLASDALALIKAQQETIDELISADKALKEIVRCKDCKYLLEHDSYEWECEKKFGWFPVKPDWFCADGERKEGW